MKALQSCSPVFSHFLDLVHLQPLVDTYSLDKRALSLESEFPLVKRTLAKKTIQDTSDALFELATLSVAFSVTRMLLKIAMTIYICQYC